MALTVDELLTYLREPNPASDMFPVLWQLVDIANGLVEEVVGTIEPEPARVQAIRLEIAARAYRNPAGHTNGAIDDYRWGGGTGRGGVHITDTERSELEALSTPAAAPWAGSLSYRRS